MRLEAEKQNAEVLKRFEETSARLAQQAERKYKEEIELLHIEYNLEKDRLEREKEGIDF